MYKRFFIYEHCNSSNQSTISLAQDTPHSSAECEYCDDGHDFFEYFDTLDELENLCQNYGLNYSEVLRNNCWQEIPRRDLYKSQEFVLFQDCNNISLAKVNCYTNLTCKVCNQFHGVQIHFETKQELIDLCGQYDISIKELLDNHPRIEVVLPRNSNETPELLRREFVPMSRPEYAGQVNMKRRYG